MFTMIAFLLNCMSGTSVPFHHGYVVCASPKFVERGLDVPKGCKNGVEK